MDMTIITRKMITKKLLVLILTAAIVAGTHNPTIELHARQNPEIPCHALRRSPSPIIANS